MLIIRTQRPRIAPVLQGIRTSYEEAAAAYEAVIRVRLDCESLLNKYGKIIPYPPQEQFWKMDAQFWKDRDYFYKQDEWSYGEYVEQAQAYEKRYADYRQQFADEARRALDAAGQTTGADPGVAFDITRTAIFPGVKPELNTWVIAGAVGIALAVGVALAFRKQ